MAEIRVRVELQRASKGIEIAKLEKLSKETQKFFRMVGEDVGIEESGRWVALDFYNQGIGFDAEYQVAEIDHQQVASYLHAVEAITRIEASNKFAIPGIRPETVVQCARMAIVADVGETIRIGLHTEKNAVDWRPLTKDRAVAIIEHFDSLIEYRGMLQGIIHSLYKEASPPHFTLRDLASRQLVRCEFSDVMYDQIHRALERKDSVVLVSGWLRAKRLDKQIDSLRVERIEPTSPMDEKRLREFFGSAPGWTGDMTTESFINSVRDADGDE